MINKPDIILKVLKKNEIKDYTYAILFFLISSFFAVAVIKPVLSIAVSLQKESRDLVVVNEMLEKNIMKVIDLQSQMEDMRDVARLVDIALPRSPELYSIIEDIKKTADQEGVDLSELNISDVSYSEAVKNKIRIISIDLTVKSEYEQSRRFLSALLGKKRLLSIRSIRIAREEKTETGGSLLNIVLEIDGYYL